MNKIFNGRLYLEGIKKIRVLGIAFSIVIIVLNALVPLTHFLIAFVQAAESGFKEGIIATVVSAEYFAVPTTLLMFFTPFFIFTIFAYLNSRAESDFYHAIPYTRASVYLSFTAAAYTWIFGILIASTSLTTLLWTINPYASFTLSTPLFVLAEYAVATLFIGAISSVAACLTGTKASQFFVTMILLFFLRITATAFVLCVQGLAPVLDINNSLLMLLSPSNYFPLSVFSNLFYGDVLSTPAPWIYALCVSAAGFAVSGVLYVKRRSETAGKSAPNKVFQHIFRCLFVLPWVAAIGALILFEAHIAFIFVLCNIALVVYFLYELITTKSAKAMLKAAPFLAVLLVVGLLFVGGAHLAKNIILSQTYTPEQIDSVGMSKENGNTLYRLLSLGKSYEEQQTARALTADEEAKKLVSDALAESVRNIREDGTLYGKGYNTYTQKTVLIKLKSGRTVGKNIVFSQNNYDAFRYRLAMSPEYGDALIRMPAEREITSVQVDGIDLTGREKEVYRAFLSDYGKLTREEQVTMKMRSMQMTSDFYGYAGYVGSSEYTRTMTVYGYAGGSSFVSVYFLNDSFTETAGLLNTLYHAQAQKGLELLRDFSEGKLDEKITRSTQTVYLSIQTFCNDGSSQRWLTIDSDLLETSEEYRSLAKEYVGLFLQSASFGETDLTDYPSFSSDIPGLCYVNYYYEEGRPNSYGSTEILGALNYDFLALHRERMEELTTRLQEMLDNRYMVEGY